MTTLLMACATLSYAAMPYGPTEDELRALPPLCAARLKGPGSPGYVQWSENLGPDFVHTHHYCFALNFLNRYYRTLSAEERRGLLSGAVGDLNYMVGAAKPSYSLMPEVYLNRGIAFKLQHRVAEAVRDLQKAIELNPRLGRAYLVLADIHVEAMQSAKALEVVTEGLRREPESKALRRRYDELGGKKPYPQPYPGAETAKATEAKPTTTTQEIKGSVDKADKAAPTAVSPEGRPPHPPESTKQVGSGPNPWCRFCPDLEGKPSPSVSTPEESTKAGK